MVAGILNLYARLKCKFETNDVVLFGESYYPGFTFYRSPVHLQTRKIVVIAIRVVHS